METKTTKQLARELGLLRKRKVCSPSDKKKKKSKIDQIFSYLVVLDFESTCWDNDKTVAQEIIEFPAVLLNCHTGDIESTFHHYILPSEHPRLSEFCKKLTGISQTQVDGGIPLSFCLRKFFYWLKKLQTDQGVVCVSDKHFSGSDNNRPKSEDKLAAFVTWSDWDLGVCLLNEARRKQIMKPSALDRWIDLRATYRKFYGRRPDGLNGAMKDLGLQFDGREHSGIDDAKNTARLAYRMMCDGCLFQITKSLKTTVTSFSDHKKTNGVPVPCHITDVKSVKPSSNKPLYVTSNTVTGGSLSFKIMEDKCINSEDKLEEGLSFMGKGLSVRNTNTALTDVSYAHSKPQKLFRNVSTDDPNKKRKQSFNIPSLANKQSEMLGKPSASNSHSLASSRFTFKPSTGQIAQLSNKSSSNSITKISPSLSAPFKSPLTSKHPSSSSFKTPTNTNKPPTFKAPTSPIIKRPDKKIPRKSPTAPSSSSSPSRLETQNKTILQITPVSSSSSILLLPRKTPATATVKPSWNTMKANSLSSASKFSSTSSSSSSFKTPTSAAASKHSIMSRMRATPPLCTCGRRSRRRLVQNPGPNEGRWFFSCTASSRSNGANSFSGCGFFQWEIAV